MSLFYRALRGLLFVIGFVAGLVGIIVAFFARQLIRPPRQRLWATPADTGLAYEEILFPARDGCRLSGWFIPTADAKRPTIVLIHGWPWNRLGNAADDALSDISGSGPVDFLRLAFTLHHAGYHLLMFDLRNHGQSAAAPPVTFGLQEANDLLGALDYLQGRDDVDQERIGAIGFSMGANSVLYSLPYTDRIRAAVLVQPTSVGSFARRFGYDLLGPLSKLVVPLTELVYTALYGLHFGAIEPLFAAAGAGKTPILYVQGTGDRWGSQASVEQMAAATPAAVPPLFVETVHRFGGYQYLIDNPRPALQFFREQLQ
jgi:pimeloyl-ACP methyl ester carboxylesterase